MKTNYILSFFLYRTISPEPSSGQNNNSVDGRWVSLDTNNSVRSREQFVGEEIYKQSSNKAAPDGKIYVGHVEVDNKEADVAVSNGDVNIENNDELMTQSKPVSTNVILTSEVNETTKNIISTRKGGSNETCKPITKIVFIKTHKTGSTTMASIFERFGYRNRLIFALPRAKHVFATNSYFSRKGVIPMPSVLAKSHLHFDILDNHAIYHRPEMDKTVPNATYITILRDPVAQLESAFGYYEMAKGMGISNHTNPFETFMHRPLHYYKNTSYNFKTRSRNAQLYDLGLINTRLFDDKNAILRKIYSLDKELDLVLITEYFDESLILMKKLLCWSFDDILYISNGIRSKSHRFRISDDLKGRIRQWNAGDVLLYNHFNRTLWQKIEDYGPSFQADFK